MIIRLPKGVWEYDPREVLGRPGGFGTVFAGTSEAGPIAVKRLHLGAEQAAHRELRVAQELEGRELNHVMPVLDAGQDSESGAYFVVMPRAEGNLQQELARLGKFAETETVGILDGIAAGLYEVGDLVHRDLKPANVLRHDSSWKVADFGIAKFVEESTSLATLKDCLTAPYAAPEQWLFQTATHAVDVYALGCIGYALLAGGPPFPGPDFRSQHLSCAPTGIHGITPRLSSLLSMMLRKTPETRPSLGRVRKMLSEVLKDCGAGQQKGSYEALAKVNAKLTEAESEAERKRAVLAAEVAHRRGLYHEGGSVLQALFDGVADRIQGAAPLANRHDRSIPSPLDRIASVLLGVHLDVRLGGAVLHVQNQTELLPKGVFQETSWDVIRGVTIAVRQASPPYIWGSSLWYAKPPNAQEYRWYEVSYFAFRDGNVNAPYAISDHARADRAAVRGLRSELIAWGPAAIDDENEEEFVDRWTALFAMGCNGELNHPSSLPLPRTYWEPNR